MFAIKNLTHFLGNENPLSQQVQETLGYENLDNKDEVGTDKEEEYEVKNEEITECPEEAGDVASKPAKVEVEKGEDDDSTAPISDSFYSTYGHIELLTEDTFASSPVPNNKNNNAKSNDDSGLQELQAVFHSDWQEKEDTEIENSTTESTEKVNPKNINERRTGANVAENLEEMVSMLWASSPPNKKSTMNEQESMRQEVDERIIQDQKDTIVREIVPKERHENHNEIEGKPAKNENDSGKIIQETTTRDDGDRVDGINVATNNKFLEVSSSFVDIVGKEKYDWRSYGEITVGDSEYEEATIDEDALLFRQDGNVKSRQEVQGKEIEVIIESKASEKSSNHGSEFHTPLETSGNNPTNKVAILPPTASASKENEANHNIERSKLSPRIAEKMKLFDSPQSTEGKHPSIVSKETWQNSKPSYQIKLLCGEELNKGSPKDEVINPKMPTGSPARSKRDDHVGEKQPVTSRLNLEEKELLDRIVSLVKEPGALQNKQALAERITSLLTGKNKDEVTTRSSTPPKFTECPSRCKHSIEAYSYLKRKNDDFMDPGLKQLFKEIRAQKIKLRHVDDPDTIANRRMKWIAIQQREQEQEKKKREKEQEKIKFRHVDDPDTIANRHTRWTAIKEREKVQEKYQTTLKPGFKRMQKDIDPDEIMARIWPKTPSGEKSTAKPASTNTTPESQKISPRKLGDRLKIFESPNL